MLQRNIQINKFTRGVIRDGIDDKDYLQSMRNLQNYDIDYTRGQLVKRKGYTRFNLVALPDNPEQTYFYKDLAGREYTLVVTNSKLYITSATTTNTEVKNASEATPASLSFTSGTKYPFVTLDDGRCVFADNNDIYWADHTSLTSARCYQLGIDKPDWEQGGQYTQDAPTFTQYTNPQNATVNTYSELTHKLAQSFTCPTYKLYVGEVAAWISYAGTPTGTVRARIETDSSGKPSGILAFDDAVSRWFDIISEVNNGLPDTVLNLELIENGWLNANTTYWLVLEGDVNYVASYDAGVKYVRWGRSNANPYANGKAMSYNGTTWSDIANSDFRFLVGGNPPTIKIYYRFAYYNDNYTIEPAPSEAFMLTLWSGAVRMNFPSLDDSQVTHINVYRKKYATTYSDDYYYVGRGAVADGYFVDVMRDDTMGGKLQSLTFQRPKDTDNNPIVPAYMMPHKKRLYLVKANNRTVYYSMRLDDTGALGYTGFALYDSFHSENFEQIPTAGEPITGVLPLGNQLIVYTDSQIIPIYGCDSVLNPMDDLSMPEIAKQNLGCIAPLSLVSYSNRHYFLSKRGVEEYDGNSVISISFNPNRGLYIQSIVDAWENKINTQAIITTNNEYWIVADEEGIIKYEQEIYDEEYYAVPSTQVIYIYDIDKNTWRAYQYYHTLNHILATPDNILLSPQKDVYDNTKFIMLVTNNVYSDRDDMYNEINVAGLIETQSLRPLTSEMAYNPRRWLRPPTAWHHVVVDAFHVGSPFYTCKTIDKNNNVNYADLIITSDVRSKRTGLRVNSEECRFRIRQFSKTKDEIRGIIAEWTEM